MSDWITWIKINFLKSPCLHRSLAAWSFPLFYCKHFELKLVIMLEKTQRRLMPRRWRWQQLRSPTWWPKDRPTQLFPKLWQLSWPEHQGGASFRTNSWLESADFKPWWQKPDHPPIAFPPLLSRWRLCPAGLSRRRKDWCKSVNIFDHVDATEQKKNITTRGADHQKTFWIIKYV